MEELTLSWLANGNLQIRFERAVYQVLMNIADTDYEAKAKRTIIISMKLAVSENRTNSELSAEVKVKLPTEGRAIAALMIGRKNGRICASEHISPALPFEPIPGPELIEIDSNLETFANGALNARFQDAFAQLLENAIDINTPDKAARKITLTICFEPNPARTHVNVAIDSAVVLAKPHLIEQTLMIGNPPSPELLAETHPALKLN